MRAKGPFGRFLGDTRGQATVEYVVVGVILLILVVALGSLARVVQAGVFVKHAGECASHVIAQSATGVVGDIFLY
jgi:Flp pilus assembly protein TadG